MKIANTKTGMRMIFTEAEHGKIANFGKLSVSIAPTSTDDFIEIRPHDPNFGRGVSFSKHNHTTHPWRLEMLKDYWPVLKLVPQFGTEDHTFSINNNSQPRSITISKPPMKKPVMEKAPRRKKTPPHHISAHVPLHERAARLAERHNSEVQAQQAPSAKAKGSNLTLKQSVEAVNRFKEIYGPDLELAINKDGFLGALMQIGRT